MSKRLATALAAFAALGVVAFFVLHGTPLLVVTIMTTDPVYLRQPFVITSQFKKEANDAKWHPTPCSATW